MLTPLQPDFVSRYWKMFRPYLKLIAPSVESVLAAIQSEKVQMWSIAERESDKSVIAVGVIATSIVVDEISGERNLLVLALHKASEEVGISDDLWASGIERLKQYAKQQGCGNIVAFSKNPRVINMFTRLGGDCETRYLKMEVS